MSTPSAFELGRAIGGNVGGGIRQAAETSALENAIRQAQESGNPAQIQSILTPFLPRLSPENRELAGQLVSSAQKQQLYQQLGLGGGSQGAPSSTPGQPGYGMARGQQPVAAQNVPFAKAKAAALAGEVPLSRILADEEKLERKQNYEMRKEAEPKLLELEDSLSNLKNQDMKFERLSSLFSPELEDKFPPRALAAAFTKHGDLSSLGQSLLSDEAQEAVKLITDEIKGAKDTFGARVSNFEAAKYLQTLPSLLNSPGGRRRVLRDLKMVNQINQMEKQGILDVMDRYGGPGSISLSKATGIFRKEFEPRRKELAEEFANPEKKLFKEMPNPSLYAGKRLRLEETGQIFKSNGKEWVPEEGSNGV